jgi:transposase
VGGPPGAAGHGPACLEEPALGPGRPGLPGVSGCVSSLFGTKVGRLVLAEFTDPARLSALGVAGFQQVAATRGVQVLAPVAERLVAAAQVAILTDQPRWPGPSSTATSPCWPPSTPRSPRPTSAWPPCCHAPRSPCCAAALAGGWSGLPPMERRSATRHGGQRPARLSGQRAVPSNLRLGRPPRRRRYQPGRLGHHAAGRAVTRGGLWRLDPAARAYAASLRARGKPPGVIATAMANRANRIAFAMVRDQRPDDPNRWR